jgi:signal transduction histidine kinase
MNLAANYERFLELRAYVGWTEEDAARVASLGSLLAPHFVELIDDFYAEIQRHPEASKVITGGMAQIERLKGTLRGWLRDLFAGQYDAEYVSRRWRVGWRHVEIGLDQVYTNVALSRLRMGLLRVLRENWPGDPVELPRYSASLNVLLDLDLAIITEAYQAEMLARQQRIERLAAIGQVAGGVAHELRNPLNVVKTSIYYLLNARQASDAKKAEHLSRIERQVVVADGVITALSNFARLPAPTQEPFDIRACVEEALESNPVLPTCRVHLDVPPLPPALADVQQIRIVLGNLIRNAREAMPEGGELRISGRLVGDRIEVAVSDTGVGIPPEQLARILEPLYSTKARGLGLGLSIARAILEKNQGELRVQSIQGRGSTFTVVLRAGGETPARQP